MLTHYNQYSFIKTDTFKEQNSGINITRLSSFKINNNSNFIHYNGIFFPIKYHVHYGVLLDYYIGGYLQLKKIYPELKIIVFKSDQDLKNALNPRNELVIKDFIDYFKADVLDIDNNSYSFDDIILNDAELPIIPYEAYSNISNVYDEFAEETINWRLNSTKIIFEEFQHKLIKQEQKNIYVTRSFINKHYLSRTDDWSKYRKHNKEYDEILDLFFLQNNFEVIEFFNKGFFEQINIAYNAKKYIAIDGGSLINAMWCTSNCEIIKIKINKEYIKFNYYWDKVLQSVGVNISKTIDISSLNINKINKFIQDLLGW